MEKSVSLIARVFVAAIFAFTLAGCAGQQPQQEDTKSANSGELPPPTQDELLKELETLVSNDDFSSVTIEMRGVSSIGSDAAKQTSAALGESSCASSSSEALGESSSESSSSADLGESSSESSSSADLGESSSESSSSAATRAIGAEDDEGDVEDVDAEPTDSATSEDVDANGDSDTESESDVDQDVDAEGLDEEGISDELDGSANSEGESRDEDAKSGDSASKQDTASDDDEVLSVVAKCEQSNGATKTQATIDVQNRTIELYIDGDKAIMVRSGQVTEGTLEKLGMTQYANLKSIIQSQAADISTFADDVENIETTKDDTKTVYKVTCNPEMFAKSNAATTVFSKYNKSMKLESAEVVYTFDSSRRLVAVETIVSGPEFNAKYASKLTDYDATKVASAPDASSLSNEEGSEDGEYEDYGEYDDEYVEEDDASTSDSDSESGEEESTDSESSNEETE